MTLPVGVKEFMRMMGLPGYINWAAWFVSAISSCLITNLIIVALLSIDFKYGAVVEYADFLAVYIFFMLYSISLIFMMFAISTLFNNANVALAAGIVIHIISYYWPYVAFASDPESYLELSKEAKMGAAIFPNAGLYMGVRGILRLADEIECRNPNHS